MRWSKARSMETRSYDFCPVRFHAVSVCFPLVSVFYLVLEGFVSSPFPVRFPSFPVRAYRWEIGNKA